MGYEHIPSELRRLKQWVCWRLIEREGRMTKMPCQPNGRPANSTDRTTWSTFTQCVQASERFSGIGFVFATGYVGIDLDKVRDPQSGETEEWARKVIRELDSYTELSQSGTGWHVIIRSQLPSGGNRKGRMEMYDSGRFFVMTGKQPTGTSREIQSRDVADLQRRMLAGLDPKPPELMTRAVGRKAGRDESAEDYKIIAGLIRRLRTTDADLIESEIRRRFPERYTERAEVKGTRGQQGYWAYSVERALNQMSVSAG